MSAREVALMVVRDVFPPGQATQRSAQEALDYRLQRAELSDRDRAFATELAYGSIKMRRTLDFYLEPYIGGRDKPVPPTIHEILRLGIYEIVFTRAQEHATVNELVGLAKKHGHRGTAGLVNAVLRGFLRDKPEPPQAESFESRDEYLGVRYSFPTWMVKSWRSQFGDDAIETILSGLNEPPRGAVCVNTGRTTVESVRAYFESAGVEASSSEFAPEALLIGDAAFARTHESDADGNWWQQSESAAMPVDILNPQPGEAILDVCSGRGNKAIQTGARLNGEGSLICIERDDRKSALLQTRLQAAGIHAGVVIGDATEPLVDQHFDRILVDAPCSGLGIVGRHPEARWRKDPTDGARLARTQAAMLEAVASRVQPGGTLVYAVCSTDPCETVEIIEPFLQNRPFARGLVPQRYEALQTAAGDLLVPPGLHGRDGFFIARLERAL
ncbi:MAG: 16S rRNA (cytosine(967)-C(5))-methyltransferase RsmB [Candidatus Eremiobacteraeota bacterium]|nr:16S rRNA (cytosine(967)-C(5))-methyltransferase RsmB [Candidatus Eremiobacteraeota bacterium]